MLFYVLYLFVLEMYMISNISDLTISGHSCTIIALDIELTADSSTPVTVMDKPQRNIKRYVVITSVLKLCMLPEG
jgi:hypothetical protein